MEPENIRFGGGPSSTLLHPLVAVAMLISIVLILVLPRKYVIYPTMLALFLIPKGQQIVAAGIHLNVYRIIILAGLLRLIISRKSAPYAGGFTFMDQICTTFFLTYYVMNSLLYHMQSQAMIKNTGDLLDAAGGYLVMRFLIRDREDIYRTIKAFAYVAIVCAICMMNEQRTGSNVFGILGGVPAETVRDGKIRSQASFEVFLTAGTYGAVLVPLLVWLWSVGKSKLIAGLGIVSSCIMLYTCFASTTLVGCVGGIIALCMWPIRRYMRVVRWGLVALVVTLHMVMNGPVWSIVEHIDLTGSSSSYHRYMLMDNFVRHFGDWWLVGTTANGNWGWDMWDLSNQYVAYAFTGGLLCFILFLAIITKAFSRLGIARKLVEGNKPEEWFLWCLGASLVSHLVGFFGINYMDQMEFGWLALLVIISVAVYEATSSKVPEVEATEPDFAVFAPNPRPQQEIKV
jgi:hypothetical protein